MYAERGPKVPRVLHVVSSLSTYGAERLVANLAGAMPRDFDVAVMTMYSVDPAVACSFNRTLLDVGRRRGASDVSFFPRMVGMMRRWRPHIVHTHVHNGKYWGRLAAVTAGVGSIVHTEHNSDFRANPAVQAANRALHARTSRIVAFSGEHAERIAHAERVPPAKLAVIPNGITTGPASGKRAQTRASLGDDGRAIVLHVGRFEPVKNQALAVWAFAASESLRSRARLFFAGSGADEAAMRALVDARGLHSDIAFLGYRSDVPDLLAAADAVLITSRNEAMPLAAVEAMAAGVPLVSVPWQGSADFFDGGRLAAIASSYEPADVADTVLRVLDEPEATLIRTAAAEETARTQYSLDACVRHHAELYRALL